MQVRIFIVIFFSLIFESYSQIAGQSKAYTLEECIETALRNNYQIQLKQAQMSSAGAQVTGAFGAYLPSINFNMGYQRLLNPDGGRTANIGGQIITVGKQEPNSYNMNASASMQIFDGMNREAIYSQAQQNFEYTANLSKHTIMKVEFDIISQYIDVIKNIQVIKTRQENLALAKNQLEKIKAQFDAGLIPVGNVYAQEAEVGNNELELVVAENNLNISKINLLALMGLMPDPNAEFLESSLPADVSQQELQNFRSKIGSVGNILEEAHKNRLDFAASQNYIKAANDAVLSAQSGYFPKLYAQGGWSWSNSAFNNFSEYGRSYIGLNLQVPIFENFRSNAQIQSAKLQVKEAEIQQLQLEQNIISSVQNSYQNLESAEKQIEITDRTLKFAQQSYESTKERFDLGSANITDLLTATNQLVNTRINRINAIYNYILAQKNILFISGKL